MQNLIWALSNIIRQQPLTDEEVLNQVGM